MVKLYHKLMLILGIIMAASRFATTVIVSLPYCLEEEMGSNCCACLEDVDGIFWKSILRYLNNEELYKLPSGSLRSSNMAFRKN
jgi:hypothetical protein